MEYLGQAIDELQEKLGGISSTKLGNLLGVSERSISEWKRKRMNDIPPKAVRALRTLDVVNEVRKICPGYSPQEIYSLLENGRISLGGIDDEDSISLIGFIRANPNVKPWLPQVKDAITDFEEFMKVRRRGTRPSVPIQFSR